MESNQPNNLIEAMPTVPAAEPVTSVAPLPLGTQPTKLVEQMPTQPSAAPDASTTIEAIPSVQNTSPVDSQKNMVPLFDFTGYVEGKSVPAGMLDIARFVAAFGQQSMQNPENSSPPSQGAK